MKNKNNLINLTNLKEIEIIEEKNMLNEIKKDIKNINDQIRAQNQYISRIINENKIIKDLLDKYKNSIYE